VILDPGQVPDQPRDRVANGVRPEGKLFGGQAHDRVVDSFTDPFECIREQTGAGHVAPSKYGARRGRGLWASWSGCQFTAITPRGAMRRRGGPNSAQARVFPNGSPRPTRSLTRRRP